MRTWEILLVVVLACHTALIDADEQHTVVKLVHAIFRHGPRTPADTYPNDPHINYGFEPYGWGQLTNVGKLSQYRQGQYLRNRYDEFLGKIYSPKLVEVQTTGVDRTIMSAALEMAGMWPPAPEQKWNPDLDWQPAVIRSTPLNKDKLLLVRTPCSKYYKELEQVTKSPEVQRRVEELGGPQLFEELTNKTGMPIRTPDDVLSVYGTLRAEHDFSLTLPEWTNDYYPHRLLPLAAFSLEISAYNDIMRKIKGGPLLKKIIRDSQAKIAGNNEHLLYMYAGHDSTISNFLINLGVWDPQVPEYGILVLVELLQEPVSEEYGIKIFLRNNTEHEPYPLTIPGCGHYCPFSQFVELTRDRIPDNMETLCHVDDPNYVPPSPPPP